jgi:hypothetical protein
MRAAALTRAAGVSLGGLLVLTAGFPACRGGRSAQDSGSAATQVRIEADAAPPASRPDHRAAEPEPEIGLGNIGTPCTCPSSEHANGSGEVSGFGILGLPMVLPAAIVSDVAEVRGSMAAEIIRRVVLRHQGELMACYEPALARHPRLHGRLDVRITIEPSGGVDAAAVRHSTVRDTSVQACFIAAIRQWQFWKTLDGQPAVVSERFRLIPRRRRR